MIKESTPEEDKLLSEIKSQVEIDPLFKDKAKANSSVRPYNSTMDQEPKFTEEEIYAEERLVLRNTKKTQSTSDNAHVDRNQNLSVSGDRRQTTSDIAQVGLTSELAKFFRNQHNKLKF